MAISASGCPGGGLARAGTSSLQCWLQGWAYLGSYAHPKSVLVAGGWRPGLARRGLWASPGIQGNGEWGKEAPQRD